jgi:Kef-type K+ transport system membrane component KefB
MFTQSELFLVVLFVIFAAPYFVWRFLKTDKYAPLVVVQIVSGILLGPGILGAAISSSYEQVFTPGVKTMLSGVAIWAVVLFVFTAGVEIDIRSALEHKKDTAVTAFFALVSPLVMGSAFALLLWNNSDWHGEKASEWQFLLGIGMTSAVTALPILVLILDKMHMLKQEIGIRCLRYASFDDILIWTVMAIILLQWDKVIRQAIFLLAYIAIARIFLKYCHLISHQDRLPISLVWVVICSVASDWSGMHYMVGGFLAGLIISESWLGHNVLENLRHYVLVLLMPVFFLSTGLRTEWSVGGATVLIVAIGLFVVQVVAKLIGVGIAGRILGWKKGEATTLGWLLQTKALIEIIFCTILLDKEIITAQMFTAMLIMAVVSTSATTPVISRRLKMGASLAK